MAENNGLRAVGAGEDVPHGEQDRRREIYIYIIYMINIQDFYVYFYVLYIFLQ